jgi:hypothetical protein
MTIGFQLNCKHFYISYYAPATPQLRPQEARARYADLTTHSYVCDVTTAGITQLKFAVQNLTLSGAIKAADGAVLWSPVSTTDRDEGQPPRRERHLYT